MDTAAAAISLSPAAIAVTLAVGGALIAGLVTLLIIVGRKLGEILKARLEDVKNYGKKLDEFFKAQADKDALLVERYSILNERLKGYESNWATLQERLREGSQTMASLRESIESSKKREDAFQKDLLEKQAKFEQEVHSRQLSFASQWQTTLVDLSNRFVGREALTEYRTRHEQDHGRIEVRLARQEELTEKMEQTVHGIEQKLEGGIQTIASLLAKHVTVGASRAAEPEKCGD